MLFRLWCARMSFYVMLTFCVYMRMYHILILFFIDQLVALKPKIHFLIKIRIAIIDNICMRFLFFLIFNGKFIKIESFLLQHHMNGQKSIGHTANVLLNLKLSPQNYKENGFPPGYPFLVTISLPTYHFQQLREVSVLVRPMG